MASGGKSILAGVSPFGVDISASPLEFPTDSMSRRKDEADVEIELGVSKPKSSVDCCDNGSGVRSGSSSVVEPSGAVLFLSGDSIEKVATDPSSCSTKTSCSSTFDLPRCT